MFHNYCHLPKPTYFPLFCSYERVYHFQHLKNETLFPAPQKKVLWGLVFVALLHKHISSKRKEKKGIISCAVLLVPDCSFMLLPFLCDMNCHENAPWLMTLSPSLNLWHYFHEKEGFPWWQKKIIGTSWVKGQQGVREVSKSHNQQWQAITRELKKKVRPWVWRRRGRRGTDDSGEARSTGKIHE